VLLEVVDEVVDDEDELDVLFVVDEVEEEVIVDDDVVLEDFVDDVVELLLVEDVVVVEPAWIASAITPKSLPCDVPNASFADESVVPESISYCA
jgi:hypothetical protein